jgi:hypothetical protein
VVAALLDQIWPTLDSVRASGALLRRVSLRVPEWGDLAGAAEAFVRRLPRIGVVDYLLSWDVSKKGEPHIYGYVVGDSNEVKAEWLTCSGARREAMDVRRVTGWKAFVSTGDPDVPAGNNRSFRENLTHSMHYAFKKWPEQHGSRDFARHVLVGGAFKAPWKDAMAAALTGDPTPLLRGPDDQPAPASRKIQPTEESAGLPGRAPAATW